MGTITRRAALAGLSATLAIPAVALDDAARMAGGLDQLRCLVILHEGERRLARAFRGPAPDRAANVKSVSKTLVALVAGAAFARGVAAGPEARLVDVAPRLIPRGADPRVEAITLGHLLSMTAGLERTSGANYGRWVESRNWVAHALSRPFVAEPGAAFQYSTGTFHILGAALAVASGRSLHDMAADWLARPLGISIPPWTRDPQGFFLGGNEMALSPLALARIGEMVRLGGIRDGREVIPADWLETSMVPRARSPFSGDDYGYGWFLTELGGERAAYARGYGGQMLFILPGRALVIAITSDPNRPARTAGHVGDLRRLVTDGILPAFEA